MESFRIAVFADRHDNVPAQETVSWSELIEHLTNIPEVDCTPCQGNNCTAKDRTPWSPVTYLPKERAPTLENGEVVRRKVNVETVNLAVFDLDHLDRDVLEHVAQRVDGYRCIVHSTHRHQPPSDYSIRIVLPLSRPVAGPDWDDFWPAAIRYLDIPVDPNTSDASRLFYSPTIIKGREPFTAVNEGKVLDVNEILGSRRPVVIASTEPSTENIEPAADVPVDLSALIEKLKDTRNNHRRNKHDKKAMAKAAVIDRILKGEPLAQPGDPNLHLPGLPSDVPVGRDNAINQAMKLLACCFPQNTPADAALAIVRRSLGSMQTEPEGLDYWVKNAQKKYEIGMRGRIERDKKQAEIDARTHVFAERLLSRFSAAQKAKETDPQADSESEDVSDEDSNPAWLDSLIWRQPKDPEEKPKLVSCPSNVTLILENDDPWKGVFRFNEHTKTVTVHGGPISPQDHDDSVLSRAVGDVLEREYRITISEQVLRSCILLVARHNNYDPLSDYLEDRTWDNQPRIDSFLERCCGAELKDERGRDLTAYIRSVSRKWFISTAIRGLSPGEKVDTVLVLEGLMGKGKSTLFDVLGGGFYTSSQIDISNKDSQMLAAQSWIIELAELDAIRKSDRSAINAFLSRRVDHFRRPFGAKMEPYPRRCVFVGTTEDDDWVPDMKGIRRWWPVRIGKIDLATARVERDQLWAEAVVIAKRALKAKSEGLEPAPEDRWWFNEEEDVFVREQAAARVSAPAAWSEYIAEWWYGMEPGKRPAVVRASQIAIDVLQMSKDKVKDSVYKDIAAALHSLGFGRSKANRVSGDVVRGYPATEALLTAPKQVKGKNSTFQVIAGAKATS